MKITRFTGGQQRGRSSSGSEPSSVSDTENSVRERERIQMQEALCIEYRAPRSAYGQGTAQAAVPFH